MDKSRARGLENSGSRGKGAGRGLSAQGHASSFLVLLTSVTVNSPLQSP